MASKTIKANVIIGGAMAGTLKTALSSTRDGLKQIGEAIAAVDRRSRLMAQSIDTFGRQGKNVDGLRRQYVQLTAASERLRAAQSRLASVQNAIDANSARRAQLRGQMFDAVAAAVVVGAPIRAAMNFETAMLGVAKQVEGARDAAGNLTPIYFDMAKQIQQLAREVPMATTELADMAAAGARMGVARQDLVDYVRTTAMMAEAFELPAGQLADDMGKIAGLFQIPIPRIGELADAINYLDDNAIAKGGDIIDVMRRIGGMAQTLKMPAKEAAALASTWLTMGSSAEVAGTASNAVMRILGAATAQSKKVRAGLESIGLDPKTVQEGMARDATGTILSVLDKLNALGDEERMVATTRIFGAEYGDDLAKLATGVDEYRRQLALANGEAAKGSMSREFQARLKSTQAQWQIMKNRVTEVGVSIGSALLPAINDLLLTVGPVVSKFADWARENPRVTKTIVGTAAALTSLRVASLGVGYAWTFLRGGWLAVRAVFARFSAAKATSDVAKLGATAARAAGLFSRIGAAITAIGAGPVAVIGAVLVGVALTVRKYWEPIKAFFGGFLEGLQAFAVPLFGRMSAALAPLKPIWDSIAASLSQAWNWFMQLIAPVDMTAEELQGATEAGRMFGTVVGIVLTKVIDMIGVTIGTVASIGNALGTAAGFIHVTFSDAFEKLKSIISAAVTWIMDKIAPLRDAVSWIGDTASKVQGFASGVGNRVLNWAAGEAGADPLPAPAGGRTPPPAPAAARRGGGATQVTQQNTFQITQQPGESQEELAKRIIDEQERRNAIRRRGALADGAD